MVTWAAVDKGCAGKSSLSFFSLYVWSVDGCVSLHLYERVFMYVCVCAFTYPRPPFFLLALLACFSPLLPFCQISLVSYK